jgi:hypothetical protein
MCSADSLTHVDPTLCLNLHVRLASTNPVSLTTNRVCIPSRNNILIKSPKFPDRTSSQQACYSMVTVGSSNKGYLHLAPTLNTRVVTLHLPIWLHQEVLNEAQAHFTFTFTWINNGSVLALAWGNWGILRNILHRIARLRADQLRLEHVGFRVGSRTANHPTATFGPWKYTAVIDNLRPAGLMYAVRVTPNVKTRSAARAKTGHFQMAFVQ